MEKGVKTEGHTIYQAKIFNKTKTQRQRQGKKRRRKKAPAVFAVPTPALCSRLFNSGSNQSVQYSTSMTSRSLLSPLLLLLLVRSKWFSKEAMAVLMYLRNRGLSTLLLDNVTFSSPCGNRRYSRSNFSNEFHQVDVSSATKQEQRRKSAWTGEQWQKKIQGRKRCQSVGFHQECSIDRLIETTLRKTAARIHF